MRLTSTRIVLAIMIPSVLLAVVLGLGEAMLRIPLDQTESMELAEFDVRGRKFRIPRAYLVLRNQWFGEKTESGVLMEALLPDLGPYTQEKAIHYQPGGDLARKGVSFDIWGIKFNPGAFKEYFEPKYLATCEGEVFGFRRCPDWVKDKEILVRTEGEKRIAIRCTRERMHDAIGLELNAMCEAYLPLVDNVRLSIGFERMHLERTDEIVARVYELVCGFFVPDRSGTLTYNFCENGVYTHGQTK